ncbi:LPXTG cell wall anchor domain-containing protein [Staphylococcus aureus]|nr:LPXTG cell wall anchor domain-containing protein [Staphylococcus aureus]
MPQTGQLWWPVYTLVGLGSVMIVLGFIQNRR